MAKGHAFPVLDAFRGTAATVVVIDHYPQLFNVTTRGLAPVHLFFVISGVVIAHAYERRLDSGLSIGRFLRLRLIRLYPLYMLGTAATVLLGVFGVMSFGAPLDTPFAYSLTLVTAAFMLPSPVTEILYPLNPVAWSLLFEIVINVFYVFTWRHWTIPNLIAGAGLAFALLLGCRAYFHFFETGWAWSNAFGGLASALYCFPVGVLIFRLLQRGWIKFIFPWWVPVSLLTLVALMQPPAGRLGDLWQLATITLFGPLLVASAVTCYPAQWVRRVSSLSGDASYGVYTLHIAFFSFIVFFNGSATTWLGWPALAALIAVCLIADNYIDAPVRSRLTGLVTGAPTAQHSGEAL